MQEKIYIEKSDEITVVVERLRQSKAAHCLLFVPKQALILQSAINLRLLKRESEKYDKDIVIVTHDEDGALLAQRAGIDIQTSLQAPQQEEQGEIQHTDINTSKEQDDESNEAQEQETSVDDGGRPRTIGSQDYFAAPMQKKKKEDTQSVRFSGTDMPRNREMVEAEHPMGQSVQSLGKTTVEEAPKPETQQVQRAFIEPLKKSQQQVQVAVDQQVQQKQLVTPPVQPAARLQQTQQPQQQVSAQPQQPVRQMQQPAMQQQPMQREVRNMTRDTTQSRSIDTQRRQVQSAPHRRMEDSVRRPMNDVPQNATQKPMRAATPAPQQKRFVRSDVIAAKSEGAPARSVSSPKNSVPTRREYSMQQKPQKRTSGARSPFGGSKDRYDTLPHHTKDRSFSRGMRIFIFAAAALILFVIAFSVLPRTKMTISAKRADVESTLSFDARASVSTADLERRMIPARLITKDNITVTETFPSTGESSASVHKARGRITIINTFGTQSQSLVATTRFESPDGKVFRLLKGVTVPGSAKEGSVLKPGTITADVEADQGGESYNIDPTTFTIPGFSGEKFKKFSGTSEEKMRGGGASGSEIKVVAQADVDSAKETMEKKAKEKAHEELLALIKEQGGGVFSEDLVELTITKSQSALVADVAADEFEYTVEATAKMLTFSEEHVNTVVEGALAEKAPDALDVSSDTIEVNFDKFSPDFEKQEIAIGVSGKGSFVATIDTSKFSEDIYGKKIDAVREIITKDYQDKIERVQMKFTPAWPGFFKRRISPFKIMLRVDVE